MSDTTIIDNQEINIVRGRNENEVERRLGEASWGAFFVWMGFALIANVGWGIGLAGVGVVALGEQLVRLYLGVRHENFWIAVGFFFLAAGAWELFGITLAFVPMICIVSGILLLGSALIDRTRVRTGPRT